MIEEDKVVRESLRSSFEARLDGIVSRHLAVSPHALIPNHHFARASDECIESFEVGHFIACITLVQAVAEGIARFVCMRTATKSAKDQFTRVRRLLSAKLITAECAKAFHCISDMQRDDFHHMNPTVPTDWSELEALAKEALDHLATVEGEIFAFDFDEGKLTPKNPRYWDVRPNGTTTIYLRGR